MVSQVVVTGGCGMLGGSLVRRLRDTGFAVHSVDRRAPGQPLPGVRYTVADVRDTAAMGAALAGADALVHTAAALPSYPAEQIRSVIVSGTETVLAAAWAAGVPRIVHVSSTAVYGLPNVVPTPEDCPPAPVDVYGRSKVAAEGLAGQLRDAGRCVTVLRPKTFLGPGRMGLFSMLFEWAEEGHHFPVLGHGDVRIQMLALDDLVDAVLTVLRAPQGLANDTYNIAADEFGTLREDFQAVLDAAGHGRRVISVPARPAVAVLRGLQRMRLSPVYGRLLSKLLADSYVSTDKARERLGFKPRWSNQDAILRTYEWWRSERRANTPVTTRTAGRTSRDPWRQGALGLAKAIF